MSKSTAWILCLIMALTVFNMPVYAAGEDDVTSEGSETVVEETVNAPAEAESEETDAEIDAESEEVSEPEPEAEINEEAGDELQAMGAAGEPITGSFDAVEGKDIATIRYYTTEDRSSFKFAEFQYNESSGTYDYTFDTPYDGFEVVQGTNDSENNPTVIAEYYSLKKWDGAVDVSWYDSSKSTYNIGTPAEFAGVAAIVNGSINTSTPIWMVKGEREDYTQEYASDMTDTAAKEGLPACIENQYYKKTSLIAGVEGEAYKGLAKNDFANKTIRLTSDLDMGGVDGSQIDQTKNYSISSYTGQNAYSYPNWTPIGGEYLMDPADSSTMIIAMFNGTLDGNGHHVKNLYCYRWSYAYPDRVGYTAYGYAQGAGLVGMIGSLYDGEAQPSVMPGVRNMSLSGYVFGRRMVGGFVGCMGGGSNAATGTSVSGVTMENLANHAYVYATDSKGLGGIVACSMLKGNIINCYNDGYLDGVNYENIPTGGIVGSNEGMNVYCCYNAGTINTHGTQHGRGIGGNGSGSDYTVSDCYYLNGAGDDLNYPGYYTYNMAESISVTTTGMSRKEMTDGTLLSKLNVNGTAFVEGDDGFPALYWEKHSGTGSLTVVQPEEGGTVNADQAGNMPNGTIAFLTNKSDAGWKFRYYTANGQRLSGHYVTVNGDTTVSGVFEASVAGSISIEKSSVCDFTVTKNGQAEIDGVMQEVTDYPVHSGDPLYADDTLIVEATLKDGVVPDDVNKQYRASAGLDNPFEYSYTYTGQETQKTKGKTFKVDETIEGDDITLTLSVEALTTYKLWRYIADTSWYNDTDTEFTLTTPEQLAGLAKLVYEYKNDDDPDDKFAFAGKTIKLGNDISLKNTDGTDGDRFWDGIGTSMKYFSGTFDGQGHEIRDIQGSTRGLFGYCTGSDTDHKAVIKNVTVRGEMSGDEACGIASRISNAEVKNCTSYCSIDGTKHAAGVVAYARDNSTVNNCVNYAGVSGTGYIGGIVGEQGLNSTISNCVNKGYTECRFATGNHVGGVAGSTSGLIEKCANYGHVLGYGTNIGGIVGQSVSAKAALTDSYNTGNVEYKNGTSANDSIGGIVGFGSYFKISNCYNYGKVSYPEDAETTHIGGVIGRETKKSTSSTSAVYYLDSSCEFAEDSVKQKDLPDASYCKGIKAASAAEFASAAKVLAGINGNNSFVLLDDGAFPEHNGLSSLHAHSGGTATCSILSKCDECGVAYGDYDKTKHGKTVLTGASEPVWTTNGYTGDQCCEDCGDVVEKGKTIPADTNKDAITIKYKSGETETYSKTYTVAEFDALKTISPYIAYSYGGTTTPYMIEASTQYVTIESILADRGLKLDHISKIGVITASSSSVVDVETLTTCNKYFESGKTYDAPAAIEIAYGSGKGTIAKISQASRQSDSLRFGYGISQEQFNNGDDLGGKRMISPVRTIIITLNEQGDADIAAADPVVEIISAIPEINTIKLTDKDAIQAARKAYDALTEDQQAIVGSDLLKKLTDAEAKIAALEKAAKNAIKPPKVKTTTLPLKVKQSIAAGSNLTISKGDAVTKVTTSNAKVLTVSGLKIKGKKTGKAKVTIKMKSGVSISYYVKVQKKKVKGKIKLGCSSKVSVAAGKTLAIKATKTPVTCTDKIKYSSSKKKVATVSSTGVIKAKTKGTAKITVKCGKTKKTIKVTVK
ncbi:MAG: Ig-like domain-containing protein [Firmicutes bacterium]|nr:Ig-like domain-containing protein [Bacillota bacterium]